MLVANRERKTVGGMTWRRGWVCALLTVATMTMNRDLGGDDTYNRYIKGQEGDWQNANMDEEKGLADLVICTAAHRSEPRNMRCQTSE